MSRHASTPSANSAAGQVPVEQRVVVDLLPPGGLDRQHVRARLRAQIEAAHHALPFLAGAHQRRPDEVADVVRGDPQRAHQPVARPVGVETLPEDRRDLRAPLGFAGQFGQQLEFEHQSRNLERGSPRAVPRRPSAGTRRGPRAWSPR